MTRAFVLGCWEKSDAWAESHKLAAALVREGLAERYGLAVHRIPGSRGDVGWGVYLVDREPDQAPPGALNLRALVRRFGLTA